MHQITRRSALRLLATTAATGFAGTAAGRGNVDRLLSTGRPVPENIAFSDDGDLYVGIIDGSVRRLDADRTDESDLGVDATTQVATYPGGVAGVAVADETLYTAVNGNAGSVYSLDLSGDDAPTEVATPLSDGRGFVNDIYVDGDRLLVTESFRGRVYEVPLGGDGGASVWTADGLLDTKSFGANGITRIDRTVYVAVTRAGNAGRIVSIPVRNDGTAGTAETYVEDESLFGADGLTARGQQLYVAVNSRDRVARVTRSQKPQTVAEGAPLSFPSEVAFDPTNPGTAFICNFSPGDADAAGVLRTHP